MRTTCSRTFKTQREAIDWSRKLGHAPACRARTASERQEEAGSLACGLTKAADEGVLVFSSFWNSSNSESFALGRQMEGPLVVNRFA
jgi:hypothetical protein